MHNTTSTPPRISIVTPSYNQADFLEECIDSVLSQGYPNLEYVIMDGGSIDGSVEIIKKYEKHLAYWQSSPDDGQYAAINAGFARTTGEIMAWLNSDDRYQPNAFLKVATAFDKYADLNWLSGRATVFYESGTIKSIDKYFPQFSRRKMLSGHIDKPFIMQEATFWRRLLWDKAGGRLDTRYKLAADTELWIRFFRTDRLFLLDDLIAGFRMQNNNRSVQNIEKYHEEARHALSIERDSLDQQEIFLTPPAPIEITVDQYGEFAEKNNIPGFNQFENRNWQAYLNSFSEWVEHRLGGLESAEFLLKEVSLWDQQSTLTSRLKKALHEQQQLAVTASKLTNQGENQFNDGNLSEALEKTNKALALWPTSAIANNNLGAILYQQGNIEKAIEHFVLSTQYDTSMPEPYRNLAVIFYELKQPDKLKWALDYYLACFPEDNEMETFYRRLMECL